MVRSASAKLSASAPQIHQQQQACQTSSLDQSHRPSRADVPTVQSGISITGLLGAEVIAISISVNFPKIAAKQFLAELRSSLDVGVSVWLGGRGCAHLSQSDRVSTEVFASTHHAVQRWQELAMASKGA